MQIYHSNARPNIHVRQQIHKSNSSVKELAKNLNVSEQTVSKWKYSAFIEDASCAPHKINYALNEMDRALIRAIRNASWLPLDEIWEMVLEQNPSISRSSVNRYLVKENINEVPEEIREKAKKFKAYSSGFLHVDVTYLPKLDGEKS